MEEKFIYGETIKRKRGRPKKSESTKQQKDNNCGQTNDNDFDNENVELCFDDGIDFEDQELASIKNEMDDIEETEEQKLELQTLMFMYHNGTEEDKAKSVEEIMNRIDKYILSLVQQHFKTYYYHYADLAQSGRLGVLSNIDKYDPTRGTLTTFFKVYILHEMKNYININVNKMSAHYSSKSKPINDAKAMFEAKGIAYTALDIHIETGIKLETITKTLRIQTNANEKYFETDSELDAAVGGTYDSPESIMIQNEKLTTFYNALNKLTPREKLVVSMKFGLNGENKHSTKALSEELNLAPDKVRKCLNGAFTKLKKDTNLRQMFRDYIKEDERYLQEEDVCIVPNEAGQLMLDSTQFKDNEIELIEVYEK